MTKNQLIYILLLILIILTINISTLQHDQQSIQDHSESDLPHYLLIAKHIAGQQPTLQPRTYQYPPLYPILLLPTLQQDTITYILLLDILLSLLTLIPLTKIIDQYTHNLYLSTTTATSILLFNIIFSIKAYGYPMILSTLLLTTLFYTLQHINKDKKHLITASITYMLLIMTKYVFFYLTPFILLWVYYTNQKNIKHTIKKTVYLYTPAIICFFIYSIYNQLQFGNPIGGYNSLTNTNAFMGIFIDTIPSKLSSIYTNLEPNIIITYYMIYIIMLSLIYLYTNKRKLPSFTKIYNPQTLTYHKLLFINFTIFFLLPAMTYNRPYLNWRYLAYATPAYLAYAAIPILLIFKETALQLAKRL